VDFFCDGTFGNGDLQVALPKAVMWSPIFSFEKYWASLDWRLCMWRDGGINSVAEAGERGSKMVQGLDCNN
jgi:hypothetical protein